MAIADLVYTVTSIVARATKRLRHHSSIFKLVHGTSFTPFINNNDKKKRKKKSKNKVEDCIWSRNIMMGEKCDPLAFSGVIHYDCEGNRVSHPPAKSPLRSPLPAFLLKLETVKAAEQR